MILYLCNVYQNKENEMDTGVCHVLQVERHWDGRVDVISPPDVHQEQSRNPQDTEQSSHVELLILLV